MAEGMTIKKGGWLEKPLYESCFAYLSWPQWQRDQFNKNLGENRRSAVDDEKIFVGSYSDVRYGVLAPNEKRANYVLKMYLGEEANLEDISEHTEETEKMSMFIEFLRYMDVKFPGLDLV